jgi:hypothetical protein
VIPTWWVPFRWPSTPASGTGAPSAVAAPTTVVGKSSLAPLAPLGASFVPFRFTNRPSGPLVGAFKPLETVKQSQAYKDIGLAKTVTGAAITVTQATIQAAVALGAAVSSAVTSAIPIVGGVINLGFAGAQAGAAKGREASETAGQNIAQAVVSFLPGLGLIGIASAAEGITDAANAKKRAHRVLREYQQAAVDVKANLPLYGKASDRLDLLYTLPRFSVSQIIAWCRDSIQAASDTLDGANKVMFKAVTQINNGQEFIGIPGRDTTQLQGVFSNGILDSYILHFACRDILARLKAPYGKVWPGGVGRNLQTFETLTGRQESIIGLSGFAGYSGPSTQFDVGNQQGIVFGSVQLLGDNRAVSPGEAVVDVAPALERIADVVDGKPGWSLWAIAKYFELAGEPTSKNFKASQLYARIVGSRAQDTIDLFPDHTPPAIPSQAEVTASVYAVINAAVAKARFGIASALFPPGTPIEAITAPSADPRSPYYSEAAAIEAYAQQSAQNNLSFP